jgi:glycerol-3-phosphate O-acyltransferase
MAKSPEVPGKHPFPMDQVMSDLKTWPLYRLSQDRERFIHHVIDESERELIHDNRNTQGLKALLANTLYHEKIRLTRKPWSVDPPDEKKFWAGVSSELTRLEQENGDQAEWEALLHKILLRYGREIQGNFDIPTYNFARQFLPVAFNRLLNASSNRNFSRVFGNRLGLHDRVHLDGNVERIRQIIRDGGTVVMVPTHFSNLDSILVGYAIDAIGLPAFIYGAGLNLFSARILAYFMNRLGAYKVDRRKKNRIYLQALKSYSTGALEEGCHSLFFPGGTRSRSGAIEKQLKLGLLSTVVEAQRRLLSSSGDQPFRKIYVVPVVINYNFVLEAPALIKDHLQEIGRERFFVEQDRYSSSGRIARFILRFFTAGSDIRVRFGDPMDILGNPVDVRGNSLDPSGKPIPLQAYFQHNGELKEDTQRDFEYTKILADRIVHSFHKFNTVMASHVVAFTAFRMIQKRHADLDLYQLLRLPEEDRTWDWNGLLLACSRVIAEIRFRCERSELYKEPILDKATDVVLKHGIRNLGIYHDKRALRIDKKSNQVTSDDLRLLYFYHNRMEGYGFERHV